MSNTKSNPIYFCYSPNQNRFLQRKGLTPVGTGKNVNNGRQFWQYQRGDDLDRLLDEWSANKPRTK